MTITAEMVKNLREQTGVGMMDCKKALTESSGDIEAAVKYLREKGMSAAAKKSDRSTNEGRVFTAIADDKSQALILVVNCETDFVAGNDAFKTFGAQVAKAALEQGVSSVEGLESVTVNGQALKQVTAETVLKLGENITYGNCELLSSKTISDYIHINGKIGVVVGFDGTISDETAKDVSMHIAASNPLYLNTEEVPQSDVDKEKDIIASQARNEGKPDQVIEKIVQGRINKFYGEICLLEQPFVKEPKQKVKDILPSGVSVSKFYRFELG